MLTEAQKEMLRQPIPKGVIFQKQGLDFIKGGWVINEANRIFGVDGWAPETVEARTFEHGGKPQGFARVKVSLLKEGVPYAWRSGVACGTGHGFDGYHQAIAEAETDALKRALSKFGPRLGLELYLRDVPTPSPMPDAMVEKITASLAKANGNAAQLVAAARARLSEYTTTPVQAMAIREAIADAESR